jgi:hypothetical protein
MREVQLTRINSQECRGGTRAVCGAGNAAGLRRLPSRRSRRGGGEAVAGRRPDGVAGWS